MNTLNTFGWFFQRIKSASHDNDGIIFIHNIFHCPHSKGKQILIVNRYMEWKLLISLL